MNKNPNSVYKIRFNDCDLFGHLNNSRYLDYLINAREDHLIEHYNLDLTEYYKNDLAWLVGSHEILYQRPAVYNELVAVQSALLCVNNHYLHLETIMMNEKQNHLKAIMRTMLIPISTKTGRKIAHSDEFMIWAKTIETTAINSTENLQERVKAINLEFKQQA